MAKKIQQVHIKVHPLFFEKIFEANRRKLQKKLNKTNLSQLDFTKMLVDYDVQIKFPKRKRK